MAKRVLYALIIAVLVLSPILKVERASAEVTPEFFAAPSAVMPGGVVVVSGYGFTPNDIVELILETTPSENLGTLPTDDLGNFAGALPIPAVNPGDYLIRALPQDATTPLTVMPALTMALSLVSGSPGTILHFMVNNLSAGQLRVDYDGLPIFGPVDVPAGVFEGDFLVPADRPDTFPGDVEVLAINTIGNQLLGSASALFVAEEPVPTNYNITNIEFPPNPVAPGYLFSVTGMVTPAPAGPLSAYDLKLIFKAGSGQVFPITVGSPILLQNGSFSITGRAPSLKGGDPMVPGSSSGGQLGIVFFDSNNTQNSMILPFGYGMEPPPPVLKVKVQDPQGNPIPNAIVDVRAFASTFGKKMTGESSGTQILSNDMGYLQIHPNQITTYLGASDPNESDPFTCKQTNAYGRTDANGIFQVQFDPELLAMMGEKVPLIVTDESKYMTTPTEIIFPLSVNGNYLGYGPGGKAELFVKKMRFSSNTNLFTDPETKNVIPTNPYVVTLNPLLPGENVAIPIIPKVKKINSSSAASVLMQHYDNYLGLGYAADTIGKFYSFPAAKFPGGWFSGNGGIEIEFQHDPLLFGSLDEENLTFTMDGVVYPFNYWGTKYPGDENCDAAVYRAVIPDFHRFSAGTHSGMISIQDLSVPARVTQYRLFFYIVEAPLWILNGKYQYRKISLSSSTITMEASQYLPGGQNSSSNLDTDVPSVGWLNNRNHMTDLVRQNLYPDKTTSITYDSESTAMALNKGSDPTEFEGDNGGGSEIIIPQTKVQILDSPKMPLYRNVFGVPPIAGATIGADMWFDAWLTTEGTIKFLGSGATSTTIIVTPEANVYVDAFFDLSVIFGLISASAHAVPSIGLKMPTQFVDGALLDSTKCFAYSLNIKWKVKAGECPLCKKKSGTKTIFNDTNPSSCTLPVGSGTAGTQAVITAETPDPPSYSPSVAVDGFGHTLMVWSDDNNNIKAKLMAGGQTTGEFNVSSGNSSIDPRVAFYAPNKAVAVWSESILTSSETDAATIDQISDAQHLQYSLWNGTAWSNPANLTAPGDSFGDGSVALAGRINTAGGSVTAVWVRNMNASMQAHEYRLYSAVFTNGNWSGAAPLDPASTAMDSDATVAYRSDGTAQAAWIRDADRDLSTLADRQIFTLQLGIGAQPVNAGLPSAAAEPSLAVNSAGEMVLAYTVGTDPNAFIGNQRQLYTSKQDCSGGCLWNTQAMTDSNGRPIHAESPTLTLSTSGQAQITYRALGFGPAFEGGPVVLPGDALGTVLGTGALAQAFVSYASPVITPTYAAQTGGTVWQTSSVYDPLMNQIYSVSSQGSGPALPTQAVNTLTAMGIATDGLNVVEPAPAFEVSSTLPDFSISSVMPSTLYPMPEGEPLSVTVSILNNGPYFASGGELGDLVVKLTWDAPAGLGSPAGEMAVPWINEGSAQFIEFLSIPEVGTLTPPPFPHLPHKLYVEVNPGHYLPESNFTNNQWVADVGGLPAPQGLTGAAQPGDSSVFLEWQPVDHTSVKGYRVYRSSDGRVFEPVGSTFIPAFVDLSGTLGQNFLYRVAAYAEDGFESDLSEPSLVEIGLLYPVFLPVVQR